MRILIICLALVLSVVTPVHAAGLLIFEDQVLSESERRAAASQLLNKASKYRRSLPALSPQDEGSLESELQNASAAGSDALAGSTSYLIWKKQTALESLARNLSRLANGRYFSKTEEIKLWVASATGLLEISYQAFSRLREQGVVSGNADYFPWFSDVYAGQILEKIIPELE